MEDDGLLDGQPNRTTISIHVLRVEDDLHTSPRFTGLFDFNPRPPCGGRRTAEQGGNCLELISIHVLRVEDDSSGPQMSRMGSNFNPRPPCGGRPKVQIQQRKRLKNFNPRPPCGGRREYRFCRIQIAEFQSTSSVWRTTFKYLYMRFDTSDFNPRPPCGGRLRVLLCQFHNILFQSTSSVWRTTIRSKTACKYHNISIHVLRVEDDTITVIITVPPNNFNPRPPCGGRL